MSSHVSDVSVKCCYKKVTMIIGIRYTVNVIVMSLDRLKCQIIDGYHFFLILLSFLYSHRIPSDIWLGARSPMTTLSFSQNLSK